MNTKIEGLLQKKQSKKGTDYYCVEFQLTPTYKAVWFPTNAEVELINQYYGNNNNFANNNVVNHDVFEDFK